MSVVERLGAIALLALTFVGCGGSPYGGPEPLSEFPNKSLDLKYDDSDGLVATLNYSFEPAGHCALLDDDAGALLNGRPVPLFRGDIQVTPPMGDDGSFNCVPPSVSVNPLPADLSPPWTIEIGDSSGVVSAKFDFQPVTPAAIGPVANPVLASWTDTLTIQMQNGPGITPPYVVQATLTSSNGFGSVETAYPAGTGSAAQITPSSLVFPEAINPESAPGPITVQVIADYFSAAELLDCQAPKCSLAQGSGTTPTWTTTNFTIQYAPAGATN
jgi:hypothetical protein